MNYPNEWSTTASGKLVEHMTKEERAAHYAALDLALTNLGNAQRQMDAEDRAHFQRERARFKASNG